MAHWLFKTEPDSFSFDDLLSGPKSTTAWDGVRNYQARNLLRDDVKKNDLVLFYHSRQDPPSAVGIAKVVREAYPDPSALDKKSKYFDEKSSKENASRWVCVDIAALKPLSRPLPLAELRKIKGLENMALLRKGQRLSIQPVTAKEWEIITKLALS